MPSMLDEYQPPSDLPGVNIDPATRERLKYLALARMGMGMAGREPIGHAMTAGIDAMTSGQEAARRDLLAQWQVYKERQQVEAVARKQQQEKAFLTKMTPEQRAAIGIRPDVWDAIMATDKPAEQYLGREESKRQNLSPEGLRTYWDERGNPIAQLPAVGSIESRVALQGGIAGAQEQAKAPYNMQQISIGSGASAVPITVRSDVASMILGSGLPDTVKRDLFKFPAEQLPSLIKELQMRNGVGAGNTQGVAPNATAVAAGVSNGGLGTVGVGANPVVQAGAIEESKVSGAGYAKQGLQIDEDAKAAAILKGRTSDMAGMLEQFSPSLAAPARKKVAEVAIALGATPGTASRIAGGDVSAMQVFQKESVQQAFEAARQQMGGVPRAYQEIQMQMQANPNLVINKDASRHIMQMWQGIADYQLDKQKAKDEWIANPTHNGSLAGFEGSFNRSHPAANYLPPVDAFKASLSAGASTPAPAAPTGPITGATATAIKNIDQRLEELRRKKAANGQ